MSYTADEIIKGIKGSNGVLTVAARRIGCTRETVVRHINKQPTVKKAYEEERDSLLDTAEGVLYTKAIKDKDTTSLIFLLKTIGRRRGYVERIDQNVSINGLSDWLAQGFEKGSES